MYNNRYTNCWKCVKYTFGSIKQLTSVSNVILLLKHLLPSVEISVYIAIDMYT